MKRFAALLGVIAIISSPLFAFAQASTTDATSAPPTSPQSESIPDGLDSCFQYYTFGSVQTSLSPSLSAAAAGAPIAFTGEITNNNPYPIVDASVYVKIFRQRDTTGAKDPNGPDVVDFFKAVDSVTLQAGQSLPISFTWAVPHDAETGSYQAAAYVVNSDRFNLSGLTFTDDVTGSLTPFTVVLGQSGSVGFDKTSVQVAGEPFLFAAFPPNVSATSSVAVSANVVNSTGAAANASITWDLYAWDSVTPGALLNTQTEQVSVAPGATEGVSYTVTDTSHSVYYLVGTLTNGGSKSIIGVRFVRDGIDTPRLNFAAVDSYPLTASSTLFACAHDTGNYAASSSMLTVQIVPTDPVERIVDSLLGLTPLLSYSGAIPGQEVALAGAVKATPASFDVVTNLYQNGALIEQDSVPYICSDLGTSCGTSDTEIAEIVGAIIIVLIIIGFIVRRRRSIDTL